MNLSCPPRLTSVALFFLLATRALPSVNLISNGSFESPSLPVGAHYHLPTGALGAWQTTVDDTFEIWSNPTSWSEAHDGKQHLELHDAHDAVFQTFPTTIGQAYSLIFFHSPRPTFDTTLSVSLNWAVIATFPELGSLISSFSWQEFRTTFVATSESTTLSFSDNPVVSGNGSHIDHVQVYAIPEPHLGAVCAAALILGLTSRRRGGGR